MTAQAKFCTAALGALALSASVPAAASVTFAVYNPVPNASAPLDNVQLVGTSSSGTLTSFGAGSPVIFDYTQGASLIALGNLDANLILNATETPAGAPLAYFDGTLSLIYSGPTETVGSITLTQNVTNLLTDTFTGAQFSEATTAANLIDSDFIGTVNYTSDLVTFVPGTDENFSLGITAASPISFYSSGYLKSFSGVSQGSFAATPVGSGGGGTPEPATWALMILGVAGIGFAARTKSRDARATA